MHTVRYLRIGVSDIMPDTKLLSAGTTNACQKKPVYRSRSLVIRDIYFILIKILFWILVSNTNFQTPKLLVYYRHVYKSKLHKIVSQAFDWDPMNKHVTMCIVQCRCTRSCRRRPAWARARSSACRARWTATRSPRCTGLRTTRRSLPETGYGPQVRH